MKNIYVHCTSNRDLLMKHFYVIVALLFALILSGCTWKNVPEAPRPNVGMSTIPLKVGIVLGESPTAKYYGPSVIDDWKSNHLFEQIIYPYREDDDVDAVAHLEINGQWKSDTVGNMVKGFIVGLTLFTASAVIGPTITGEHHAELKLENMESDIAYSYQTTTNIEWGMMAKDVGKDADRLLVKKIAVNFSDQLNRDSMRLENIFKK